MRREFPGAEQGSRHGDQGQAAVFTVIWSDIERRTIERRTIERRTIANVSRSPLGQKRVSTNFTTVKTD
jgi:hypothetical protein